MELLTNGGEALRPLAGVRVINLAVNVPGPVAARRLQALGAEVIKVEPPAGDPLESYSRAWYEALRSGQELLTLDLKAEGGWLQLEELLTEADLLITASRPAALARLELTPGAVAARFPRLCWVAVIGYPGSRADEAGHDLTYQAAEGLLTPPHLPRTLLADLAGAATAVTAALALLLGRTNTGAGGYAEVPLSEAVAGFGDPFRYGLTAAGGLLAGALPEYGLYAARTGWVAVAALEPHFRARLQAQLGLAELTREGLEQAFRARDAESWQAWAVERDLPVVGFRE
jgi:crotonobetainyl-CoA:carnitine CoA-transferase CaiB-like acyl-CoA transferase